jgi:predicted permease
LGRTFDEHDDRPKAPEVAVLSYDAWQRLFGGDPKAIGAVVNVDKTPTTIIGVMPHEFNYPAGNELWRPTHFAATEWAGYRGDGVRFANVFGRIRTGVSPAQAQAEVSLIGSQLQAEHTETDAPWRFRMDSLRNILYGSAKPVLLVLMAASFALLLIACINVANLLLSRATSRQREIALRQALGASQARLTQQYLTESLVLVLTGGGLGLAAAFTLVRLASARLPGALQQAGVAAIDGSMVGFALAVASITGVLFSMVPLLQRFSRDINTTLKQGETRSATTAGSKIREAFIAVQIGLSLVLLVGACLLAQSLWKLTKTPFGFQPEHVLTVPIKLPWGAGGNSTNRFYDETQRRLEQLPGVMAVGQTTSAPTEGYNVQNNYDADWLPHTPHQDAVRAEVRAVAGNYWQAMGIPVLAGRELRTRDKAILVNQEFVRQYLNGGSPLGRRLIYDKTTEVEIVGVVGNVRGTTGSIASQMRPEVYFAADSVPGRTLVLRTRLPDEQLSSLIAAIREQVHQVDPQQAIGAPQTLENMIGAAVATPRLNMSIMVGFAGIALLLACVGVYGVVAYSVAQRRQEIGVRMALGSTRGQISRLFLRRTLTSAAIGLAAGTVAALLLTGLLRSQLYGVEPNNPTTFLLAVLLLLIPVLAASLRPALQAASVNPVEALRTE